MVSFAVAALIAVPAANAADFGEPAAVSRPAAGQSAVGQRAAGQPAVGQPAVGQSAAGQPAVGQPAVGLPAVGQPAVGQPAVGQPAVGQSAVGQPAVGQPAVGQPIVLFPRDPSAAPPGESVRHTGAAAMPARHPITPMHPVVPVQRKPLDGRPLIPPAAVPAKLGPPPAPRPALSLETDLRPLTPAPATGAASASRQATPSG
ncbi:MAG TPA: hypothetical protein VG651_25715 [Stellaceae bacterium]|nr:hypothetical protein [Stellaceae bacterium]